MTHIQEHKNIFMIVNEAFLMSMNVHGNMITIIYILFIFLKLNMVKINMYVHKKQLTIPAIQK